MLWWGYSWFVFFVIRVITTMIAELSNYVETHCYFDLKVIEGLKSGRTILCFWGIAVNYETIVHCWSCNWLSERLQVWLSESNQESELIRVTWWTIACVEITVNGIWTREYSLANWYGELRVWRLLYEKTIVWVKNLFIPRDRNWKIRALKIRN